MAKVFPLGEHIDTAAVPSLAESLSNLRGQDLHVDARKTKFVGALGFQVLIAAGRQWIEDDHVFSVSPMSSPMREAAETLGIALSDIGADQNAAEAVQ